MNYWNRSQTKCPDMAKMKSENAPTIKNMLEVLKMVIITSKQSNKPN